jgi:hypothetical protein
MNGNTMQGKVINTGEFKYSESPVWGDKVVSPVLITFPCRVFPFILFILFYYNTIVNVWDPTTYCSTYYCMDLNLEGLKMTQESRNM